MAWERIKTRAEQEADAILEEINEEIRRQKEAERVDYSDLTRVEKTPEHPVTEKDIQWAKNRLDGPIGDEFSLYGETPEELAYTYLNGPADERYQIQYLEIREDRVHDEMERAESRRERDELIRNWDEYYLDR